MFSVFIITSLHAWYSWKYYRKIYVHPRSNTRFFLTDSIAWIKRNAKAVLIRTAVTIYTHSIEMGLFLSKLFNLFANFGDGEPTRILMLGLDAAGKLYLYIWSPGRGYVTN